MYFPFMRGKQFELAALQEISNIIQGKCVPVIEPVKKNIKRLETAITALNTNNIVPMIIINPKIGELRGLSKELQLLLSANKKIQYIPCIKYAGDIIHLKSIDLKNHAIYVESGISHEFITHITAHPPIYSLLPETSPQTAIKSVKNIIIINDPFQKKKRNADYPSKSYFSDIHTRYKSISKNIVGFSDFTMVGSDFAESGGPAYVVTIHMSYIDRKEFDAMSIMHYSSIDDKSTSNPAGKFHQALSKLILHVQKEPSFYDNTIGLQGYKRLHAQRHYPGLGEAKKLSMEHHIETICNYI